MTVVSLMAALHILWHDLNNIRHLGYLYQKYSQYIQLFQVNKMEILTMLCRTALYNCFKTQESNNYTAVVAQC